MWVRLALGRIMHSVWTVWSQAKQSITNYRINGHWMLAPIHSNNRCISLITMQDPMLVTDEGNQARCELDTHADTCVAGMNFLIQSFDGQTCDVMPYSDDYQAI
jgi:hypothetical protein